MNDEHERDGLGPPGDLPSLAQSLGHEAVQASSGAVALAAAVASLDGEAVTAGLVESAVLPDSITVLARAQHACSFQLGRRLAVPMLRRWLAMAVALIRPQDADAREQDAYTERYLAFSELDDVVSFQGQLPALEGQAFQAAITALAESLRSEGDVLSKGQRNADALITLVNAAAAADQLPASSAGLPVAATVTIGLSEAQRVAAGSPPRARLGVGRQDRPRQPRTALLGASPPS